MTKDTPDLCVYNEELSEKINQNEQFHFELFLKLHFCARYFGRTQFRMFVNIDEGQTLFTSEYHALRNFLSTESIMNIYGDINQKADAEMGIDLWNEISDQWKIFVLNENYRNTRQVTDYCNQEFSAGLVPIGIEGPDVQILDLSDSIEWIRNRYAAYPNERFAIIWDGDPQRKEVLIRTIKDFHGFNWNFSDQKGIFILTTDMARGLEFENVLVWDYQMSSGEKYISYTRSLNHLVIARNSYSSDTGNSTKDDLSNLLTQKQFIQSVNKQSETIERFIREGRLIPDLVITDDKGRKLNYFKESTLKDTAFKYGWTLIDDKNRKEMFMQMVTDMNMSASYKPVFLKGFFTYVDENGRTKLTSLMGYFQKFYEARRSQKLIVEKPGSIFVNKNYSPHDVEHLILTNPYKRFEDRSITVV